MEIEISCGCRASEPLVIAIANGFSPPKSLAIAISNDQRASYSSVITISNDLPSAKALEIGISNNRLAAGPPEIEISYRPHTPAATDSGRRVANLTDMVKKLSVPCQATVNILSTDFRKYNGI